MNELNAGELLPCPICGAQPKRNRRGRTGGVLCTGDSMIVGMIHRLQTYGVDQAEADIVWNTRHPDALVSGSSTGGVGR